MREMSKMLRSAAMLAIGLVIVNSAWGAGEIVGWGSQVLGPVGSVAKISEAGELFLGLRPDGSIIALGGNYNGQCNVPSPNSGFTAIASGGDYGMALRADTSIAAWGGNYNGQCNVPAPNTGFAAISVSKNHCLGLKSDGGVIVAWGKNDYGQCNVPSPNTGFVAVAAGGDHSLGLREDGSIVAWGRNDYGQCIVPAPNTGFRSIAAGNVHSLALKNDDSVVAWGSNDLDQGWPAGQSEEPTPNSGFVAIAAGGYHNLALKSDGSVVAWGSNGTMKGMYPCDTYQCVVPSPNTGFVAVAAGISSSMGLRSDGSVVSWGSTFIVPHPDADFVAVTAGSEHALGLRADGTIAAWGCPRGHAFDITSPNAGFIAVAASLGAIFYEPSYILDSAHSVALRSDGSVAVWGSSNALPSPNSGFVAVAAGAGVSWIGYGMRARKVTGRHSLALRADSSIAAWGVDPFGACSIPSPNSGFVAIAAGNAHSLGLRSDGSVAAWGSNSDDEQWGYGGQCDVPSPNTGFVAIAAGYYHSMGLKSDGSVAVWGSNEYGQCNVPSPNTNFVAIASGGYHCLGLKSDGSVVAWGLNTSGQCNSPVPNSGFISIAAGPSYSMGIKGPLTTGQIKLMPELTTVGLMSQVVTAAWDDAFYLESDDRTSGIRVEKPSHGLTVGTRATVFGQVRTNVDGERYIQALSATSSGVGVIEPLAMPNRSVGGGDVINPNTGQGQQGVWGWRLMMNGGQPQRAWAEDVGLNNIGLLIKTWGLVTQIETATPPVLPTWFVIDDGSDVGMKCVVSPGVTIDPGWTRVIVTGLSSCEKVGAELHRLVRVRSQADIFSY